MQKIKHIKLTADIDNLGSLRSFVSECAQELGMAMERAGDFQVVLEEVFVNICRYAYAGVRGEVEVNCFSENDCAVIEIIDSGVSFDMTAQDLPDITADVHEREIGGLGCLLIRKLMDRFVYHREDDKNILRLTGRL